MADRALGPGRQLPERAAASGEPELATKVRQVTGEKLEQAAQRVRTLGQQAAEKSPLVERTHPMAQTAAERIDSTARYLRSHELHEIPKDVEPYLRQHPVMAVCLAFIAGYMFRRIL